MPPSTWISISNGYKWYIDKCRYLLPKIPKGTKIGNRVCCDNVYDSLIFPHYPVRGIDHKPLGTGIHASAVPVVNTF